MTVALSQMAHLTCTCSLKMAMCFCPWKGTVWCPIRHLSFQKSAHGCCPCNCYMPLIYTSAKQALMLTTHWTAIWQFVHHFITKI